MKLLGFLHIEKPKKNFIDQPNNQKPKTKKLNKSHFQGFVNSQYFFMKISWIGPWVSRIDWYEGHWYGSTHMAVRLSDICSETGKKCIFCVFRLFLRLCRTASRPYRSSISAIHINQFYYPRTNPRKFHEKILTIGGAGKWHYFEWPFWFFSFQKFF